MAFPHTRPRHILIALLALLLATLPMAATASPLAEIEVIYDCDSASWVITSSKGLSNIVVSDGEEHVRTEFDDFEEEVYVWSVDDPDAVTIWVKSGRYRSGDGPGYGQRFDLETPDCDPDQDGDGYPASEDCDDTDPSINPGAVDIPNDGIDQNCDGEDLVVGDGEVRVTLTWTTDDDLDLHVVDPAGDRLWYGNTTVPSGGELDRDDNVGVCGADPEPGGVENIYWPAGGAPSGNYTVEIDNYNNCATTGTWHLQVFVDGVVVVDETGTDMENIGDAFSGAWKVFQDTFSVS